MGQPMHDAKASVNGFTHRWGHQCTSEPSRHWRPRTSRLFQQRGTRTTRRESRKSQSWGLRAPRPCIRLHDRLCQQYMCTAGRSVAGKANGESHGLQDMSNTACYSKDLASGFGSKTNPELSRKHGLSLGQASVCQRITSDVFRSLLVFSKHCTHPATLPLAQCNSFVPSKGQGAVARTKVLSKVFMLDTEERNKRNYMPYTSMKCMLNQYCSLCSLSFNDLGTMQNIFWPVCPLLTILWQLLSFRSSL